MVRFDELTACIAQVLEAPDAQATPETPLEKLPGWDSVNALRVLQELERRFAVRVPMLKFVAAKNLGDLAKLLAGHPNQVTP